MAVTVVTWIVYLVGAYLAAGVVAALALHIRGLGAIDHATIGAPVSFRVLITPGLIALWPTVLSKWRTVKRGGDAPGNPDAPLSAMRLRRIHGIAIRLLALFVPVAVGVAVMARSPDTVSGGPNPLADAAPLPVVALEVPYAIEDLPIVMRLRTDNLGSWQIEIDAERELAAPAIGLYWIDRLADSNALGTGIYLGNVWGPGERRFAIDGASVSEGGTLVLYSFVDADILSRVTIKAPSPR